MFSFQFSALKILYAKDGAEIKQPDNVKTAGSIDKSWWQHDKIRSKETSMPEDKWQTEAQ